MSAINDFPRVTTTSERQVEKKLAAITGLWTKGYNAADPTALWSQLPGGHADLRVDFVRRLRFIASLLERIANRLH